MAKSKKALTEAEGRTFKMNRMIIHRVPATKVGEKDAEKPDLSAAAVDLTPDLKTFFSRRISATMTERAAGVEQNLSSPSKVPEEIKELIGDENKLVDISRTLAAQLHTVQTGVNSDGLLVIARGSVTRTKTKKSAPAVLVMKLKTAEGTNVRKNGDVYEPQLLRDLMLTDDTKVFKAAVLAQDSGDLIGVVSDEQVRLGAKMFREDYLGMMRTEDSATQTQKYFRAVETWVDESVSDGETRRRYLSSLKVQVFSHKQELDPTQFIQDHIDKPHRDPLRKYLRESNVKLTKFERNDRLLAPKDQRMQLVTTKGVRITAEADLADLIKEVQHDGQVVTAIFDTLEP